MAWLRQRFGFRDHRGYVLPLARVLAAQTEAEPRVLYDQVADLVGVTPEERAQMPSSGGTQPVYRNRIQFARQALVDAGVIAPLESTGKRGVWTITPEGARVVTQAANDNWLLDELLRRSDAGRRQRAESRRESQEAAGLPVEPSEATAAGAPSPSGAADADSIMADVRQANEITYARLKEIVQRMDPLKFERLAGDVLCAALRAASVRVTAASHDSGIDGVLTFDDLQLRRVVFQAKRYAQGRRVERPEVDRFWAAVQRQRADYGVFVTTAEFSQGARAAAVDFGLRLVDGDAFVELMAQHSIGVRAVATFRLYEVDVTWSQDLSGD